MDTLSFAVSLLALGTLGVGFLSLTVWGLWLLYQGMLDYMRDV